MNALTEAATAGAHDDAIQNVTIRLRHALEATADDVLDANAYLLATPANFGYMNGALKHFFDGTFLQVGGALSSDGSTGSTEGHTARRPYGLVAHGRYDTTGAVRSVQLIVTALGWRQAAPVVDVMGDVTHEHLDAGYELGATLAALIAE